MSRLGEESFEARLEAARRVKHEAALGVRHDDETLSYWLRKQRHADAVRERGLHREREAHERDADERRRLGYAAWKEQQARDAEQRRRDIADVADVRSEQQRRQQAREERRLDRAHLRTRDSEYADADERRRREDEARARYAAEDERAERERHWARRESQRAQLQRERERLRAERKLREDERALQQSLRESRQQLAEERETVAASEWARLDEQRNRDRARRLARAVHVERTAGVLGDEAPALDATPEYRDALRARKRIAAVRARATGEEDEQREVARWYKNRSLDRYEAQRRALRGIDAPASPVV